MIKSDLVHRILRQNKHLRLLGAGKIVDTILDEIASALARGDRVEIRGFGTFSVRQRKARPGRNPKTGEQVSVEEKVFPHFKAGKEISRRLNRKAIQGSTP
jgi:integration host factor subunit beta